MKARHIFLLLLGFGFFTTGTAQVCTPAIGKSQVQQNQRIHQGVHQGDLTRQEARQLKGQQRHIRKMKQEARQDGKVTGREKAQIRHAQKRANRQIAAKRHNNRDRY